MTRQIAAIEAQCGRDAAARERWARLERALAGSGSATELAIADEARVRLGHARTDDQRRRLEEALAAATTTLDSGGSSNPGTLGYTCALLLAALDRRPEARASLQRAFLFPDWNLSHALARAALPAMRD